MQNFYHPADCPVASEARHWCPNTGMENGFEPSPSTHLLCDSQQSRASLSLSVLSCRLRGL